MSECVMQEVGISAIRETPNHHQTFRPSFAVVSVKHCYPPLLLAMAYHRLAAVFSVLAALYIASVSAQSSTASFTTSLLTTDVVTTVPVPLPTGAASHTTTSFETTTVATVIPVILSAFNASATSPADNSTDTDSAPVLLDTHVDAAFGVLGAILVLTGLPNAFWGHKNRW